MSDTPEAFLDEFIDAFVRGDAAVLKGLYRDDARMISPAAGVDAHGRTEIDAAWEALVKAGTVHRFEVVSREVTVAGDYAICHMRSVIHGRWAGADEDVAIPLRSTEVLQRGEDRQWRYLIDHGARFARRVGSRCLPGAQEPPETVAAVALTVPATAPA